MKSLLLVLSLILVTPVLARTTNIKACNAKGLKYLNEAIQEYAADDISAFTYKIVNAKDEAVGLFISNSDGHGIYAEICEQIAVEDGFTTASNWHYWEDDANSNPATWPLQKEFSMAQDEGRAYLKVLSISGTGEITIEFKVIGWGESDDEIVFRSEILRLVK